MDDSKWINIGLAIAGIISGISIGRLRIGRAMNGNHKNDLLTMIRFENEINAILRNMRVDIDNGFDLMKEQHAEMLRRLRKHDDDLFDIKTRLNKLEGKEN